MDFLEIVVNNQNYLINNEHIKELIAYKNSNMMPNTSKFIDGIISHKDKIVPVISIRKLLGFKSYANTQLDLLQDVEGQHIAWVKDFEHSLETGEEFTKALNPHKCMLGQWIDKTLECLKCNNYGYVDMLKKEVLEQHNALHLNGASYLKNNNSLSIDEKIDSIQKSANETIKGLHSLRENIEKLTHSFEQMIIIEINHIDVAIVVDNIEKNHTLDEKRYNSSKENLSSSSKYIQFIDHYKIDNKIMFSIKFTNEIMPLIDKFALKNDNLS